MVRKYFIITILSLITIELAEASGSFSIAGNVGYFLKHSDNKLPITKNRNLGLNYGFYTIYSFQLKRYKNLYLEFCLGLNQSKSNAYKMTVIDGDDISQFPIVLTQQSFPVDINGIFYTNKNFDIGFGASVVGLRRCISLKIKEDFFSIDPVRNFHDQLFSIGLGANLIIKVKHPFLKLFSIAIYNDIKVSFVKSIWFDKNGRDLNDFSYDYVTIELLLRTGSIFER